MAKFTAKDVFEIDKPNPFTIKEWSGLTSPNHLLRFFENCERCGAVKYTNTKCEYCGQ